MSPGSRGSAARIADDVIRVAGNEKIEFVKFMIVRRDFVVVLMHRMLACEIAHFP